MFGLSTIKSMNRAGEVCKHRKLARALNNPGGHAKDGEKGRKVSERSPSDKKAQRVISALNRRHKARRKEVRTTIGTLYARVPPYSAEDLRDFLFGIG